jgi:ribosome-associated protein
MLIVNSRIQIPESELEWTFARSSGPGGQNVNKVASKAMLRWKPTTSESLPVEVRQRFLARYGSRLTTEGELVISSQRYRDQPRNIDDAKQKLRAMIVTVLVPPKKRRPTKPSRSSVAKRLEKKQAQSQKKQRRRVPREE